MKKRLAIAVAAALLVVGSAAVAVGGTASDPLISLSYLTSTFRQKLSGQIDQEIDAKTSAVYNAAVSKADAVETQTTSGVSGSWSYSDSLTAVQCPVGSVLKVPSGSGFVFRSGTASVKAVGGDLLDVTEGKTVTSGQRLAVSHRYLAAERTEAAVTVLCGTAKIVPDGYYSFLNSGETPMPFSDVLWGDWYYDSVRYVYRAGLFNGVSDTEFSPGASMTRSMLATVLYRLAGSPYTAYSASFPDVKSTDWYYQSVSWAAGAGIVNGLGDGSYGASVPITREQMALMLYRYAGEYLGRSGTQRADLNSLPDGGRVSSWAADAVSWAVGTGIITGGQDGKINPSGTASRAEVATMLQRFSRVIY